MRYEFVKRFRLLELLWYDCMDAGEDDLSDLVDDFKHFRSLALGVADLLDYKSARVVQGRKTGFYVDGSI